MGINIPNIDCSIHLVPPKSLQEYAQQIGRAGRDGEAAVAVMMFHPGKISQSFSLWVANKNPTIMQQNFVEFQDIMSFIYSSQCRRKFVRKMLEDVEDSVPLDSPCNCDNCEESHIIQRDVAPAMKLLLSAIKEHDFPVCISRVSNALFAHAPKHKDAWDDTKSAVWGKGKALFAPTKQSDIWSSLAAVAIYELKFVVASLHSHQAPPMGHIVAYQRLALTPAGLSWLASDCQVLLVRERFVALSAWQTVPARCGVKDCTNKAIGSASLCSRHSVHSAQSEIHKSQCHQEAKRQESDVSDNKSLTGQSMVSATYAASFTSQVAVDSQTLTQRTPFTSQVVVDSRTLTQMTPPGYLTQQSQILTEQSQRSIPEPSTPHVLNQNYDISKKGLYSFDLTSDPNALSNPYMGQTYSRVSGPSKIKVLHAHSLFHM
jgi:superfamily II DNA helicase RecQ